MRRVILSADDFGLSDAVNEGIERAHRDGVLTSASLMVAGDAAADAVRRARAMPGLAVGLHLVLVEGASVLGDPRITGPDGRFGSDQAALGVRFFFDPRARRALAAEIEAQFAAYAATGLPLDHADAHKHMHLHPTVGGLMLRIGRRYGLRAIRVPHEPVAVMTACGERAGFGARALARWTGVLRAKAAAAGVGWAESVFGLAWSGHMTEPRLLRLAAALPAGVSELYFHPAAGRDAVLDRFMPDYEHEAELAALCAPRLRAALAGIERTSYGRIGAELARV